MKLYFNLILFFLLSNILVGQESLLSKNGVCYGFFKEDRWIFFTITNEDPLEVRVIPEIFSPNKYKVTSGWHAGTVKYSERKNVSNYPIVRSYFNLITLSKFWKNTVEQIGDDKLLLKVGDIEYRLEIKDSKLTFENQDLIVLDISKSPYCAFGDCNNGDGVQVSQHGIYQGSFVNGVKCGYGQFVFKDGSFYGGAWMNGIMHSKGRYLVPQKTYSDGDWVKGEFKGVSGKVNNEGLLGLIKEGLGSMTKVANILERESLNSNKSKPVLFDNYKFTVGKTWESGLIQFGKSKEIGVTCKNGSFFTVDISKYDKNGKTYYSIIQSGFEKYDSFDEALEQAKKILISEMCNNY